MEEKREDNLAVLCSEYTRKILEFLEEKVEGHYRDLKVLPSVSTFHARLHFLLEHGLIEHHFERIPLRREWYELTERGRKILQHLKDMRKVFGPGREETLLGLLSRPHTGEILEFFGQREQTQYRDLQPFYSVHTLNTRLAELCTWGLIEHHFERIPLRKEWYELTEKGKDVSHRIRALKEDLASP